MIMSWISTILQNFIQTGEGVSFLHMRDFTHRNVYSANFHFGGFCRSSTPKMLARVLTQNTSKDVVLHKDVSFGGHKTKI